ncbi:MAG: MFS transporter, partial [Ruminiclostridium sp.]|nr:MFS transporter [Ruminiclostridium sp.]
MNLINQYRGLRREVYILFFGRMVTNLGSMIWPVMTMILSQKLDLSASAISYYFVAGSLIMLPANLIGGKLADRFNKKWVIVFCDAVSVALYIICGFIPMSVATVVLFVVAGAF